MKSLSINGTNLSTFGIYLSSDTYLNSPQIDYSEYQVPARNGNVILDNKRLGNVVRKFSCYIKDDPESGIASLKKLIYSNRGYVRLVSDYDPDTYQMGYLAQEIEFDPFQSGSVLTVKFDLYFSCLPQKYDLEESSLLMITTNENYSLLSRYSQRIESLFSQIPANYIPIEKTFIQIPYTGSPTGFNTLTDVSVSWSEGGTFVALYGSENGLLAYSNIELNESSITLAQTEYYLYLITPMYTEGSLSINYTIDGTAHTDTFSFTTSRVTKTNSKALGFKMSTLELQYRIGMPQGAGNGAYICGYMGDEFTGDMFISLHNELWSQEFRIALEEYCIENTVNYQVKVDFENNEVYAFKEGLPDLRMTDYFEINGNVNYGDQVRLVVHGANGAIPLYTAKVRWWSV